MVKINHGSFIISLDFELFWGVMDCKKDSYKHNILGVQHVFPKILNLFQLYDVHATVAVVGFIFFRNKEDLLLHLPPLKPTYIHSQSSPYDNNFIEKIKKEDTNMFFAPNLIEILKKTENIEIGTHTFCHYYCWDTKQTIDQFEADIKAAIEIAEQQEIEIKSIVFPRNQFQPEYLSILSKYGITSYRGNPNAFYKKTETVFSHTTDRLFRMLDTYINIGGSHLASYESIRNTALPINIPASRFLRPYNRKLSALDFLKLYRIKREMTKAAKEHKIYHLWWHPHNFGINIEKNLSMLSEILEHYKYLHKTMDFQSYTMLELTNKLLKYYGNK